MIYTYTISGKTHTVRLERDGDSARVTVDDGEPRELRDVRVQPGTVEFETGGKRHRLHVAPRQQMRLVAQGSDVYELRLETPGSASGRGGERAADAGSLEAAMPGQVIALAVKDGDAVTKGQTLVVLEAMKMEYRVQAPRDGQVARVLVQMGQVVERGQQLVELAVA